MFSISSVAASEKGVLGGNQTRRGSFALCLSSNLLQNVTPNRHVIVLSMKKRMMSLLNEVVTAALMV